MTDKTEAIEHVIHLSMPIDFERRYAMDNLIAQDADLIDVAYRVTEADREVLIRISNSDDETAQRIRRGLIYTWEVGEIARHRQYGYDQGYYDGCTRLVIQSEDCPKCDKFGDDCGEHSPSWEELAAYWKAEAERLRAENERLEALFTNSTYETKAMMEEIDRRGAEIQALREMQGKDSHD